MDDRQTDMTFFSSVWDSSGVDYFSNDIMELLLVVIKELCDAKTGPHSFAPWVLKKVIQIVSNKEFHNNI